MKQRPKICRNCVYYDGNHLKHWCIYWRCEIGSLVRLNGCEEFEDLEYWNERMLQHE